MVGCGQGPWRRWIRGNQFDREEWSGWDRSCEGQADEEAVEVNTEELMGGGAQNQRGRGLFDQRGRGMKDRTGPDEECEQGVKKLGRDGSKNRLYANSRRNSSWASRKVLREQAQLGPDRLKKPRTGSVRDQLVGPGLVEEARSRIGRRPID